MMKLIAVTGANGYLGGAIVRALRSGSNVRLRKLIFLPLEDTDSSDVVCGDITDARVCARLVEGADVVVHAAALVRSDDEAILMRTNVIGTHTLIQTARRLGVRRFVHVSSTGIYGSPGIAVDEMSAHRPGNPYERSKSLAEAVIGTEWRGEGTVIVRPSNILGSGHPLQPLRRFLAGIKAGRPVVTAGAWTNYVGVQDVARVVVGAAMICNVPASLIVNVPLPLKELVRIAGNAVGRPGRVIAVPDIIGRALGGIVERSTATIPSSRRALSLVNQSRYCTMNEAWFNEHGLKPQLEPVLMEITREYGLTLALAGS